MPNSNVSEYLDLISKMRKLAYKMDYVINNITRYENYITKGFILNDSISFEDNLNDLKEKLIYKRNKIRNDIIPELYNCLNNQ